MPSISVVIPAYNRADTIGLAVGSVLRQTVGDIEVIVVDDASSDGTVAALEAIGDERLRVIRHARNAGGAAARNTGLRAATGDWVAFQDSDDEWLPLKLERQLAALARFGEGDAVGVYCGMIIFGRPDQSGFDPAAVRYWPNPRIRPASFEGDLYRTLLLSGSLISTQTFMGRRAALLQIGGFDESLKALQDWDCFLRIARLGPIAFEPEPLVIQRFSGNSLTRSSRNRGARPCRDHREAPPGARGDAPPARGLSSLDWLGLPAERRVRPGRARLPRIPPPPPDPPQGLGRARPPRLGRRPPPVGARRADPRCYTILRSNSPSRSGEMKKALLWLVSSRFSTVPSKP